MIKASEEARYEVEAMKLELNATKQEHRALLSRLNETKLAQVEAMKLQLEATKADHHAMLSKLNNAQKESNHQVEALKFELSATETEHRIVLSRLNHVTQQLAQAQLTIGDLRETLIALEENIEEAKRAEEEEHEWLYSHEPKPDLQFDLGRQYFLGDAVPQNYDAAAECFQKAAVHGHGLAQLNLGYCCK